MWMRNPFKHFCKSPGLSDLTVHHGGDNQNSNNQQTNAPVFVPPPASQSLVTTGHPHPTDTGGYFGGADQSTILEQPTSYPYDAQQASTMTSPTS
ncbi:hypothetical protein KSS87_014090 [Heliosperma pusillum]|nr:hypothetical protein KSS87_014090 [Heliosperma pusillum]